MTSGSGQRRSRRIDLCLHGSGTSLLSTTRSQIARNENRRQNECRDDDQRKHDQNETEQSTENAQFYALRRNSMYNWQMNLSQNCDDVILYSKAAIFD